MSTKIIKSRPTRGRFSVKGGRYVSTSLDSRTHAQLLHCVDLIRQVLGAAANQSTVIRAAVDHFTQHLDKVAAKLLEPVPEGAPVAKPADPADESLGATQERLRSRERYRVKKANEGGETPWMTMPAYVPGRPFSEVLAAGWKFKRQAQDGCVGALPIGDPVRELLNEKSEAEETAHRHTEESAS